jgi:hypothetical protein
MESFMDEFRRWSKSEVVKNRFFSLDVGVVVGMVFDFWFLDEFSALMTMRLPGNCPF